MLGVQPAAGPKQHRPVAATMPRPQQSADLFNFDAQPSTVGASAATGDAFGFDFAQPTKTAAPADFGFGVATQKPA